MQTIGAQQSGIGDFAETVAAISKEREIISPNRNQERCFVHGGCGEESFERKSHGMHDVGPQIVHYCR